MPEMIGKTYIERVAGFPDRTFTVLTAEPADSFYYEMTATPTEPPRFRCTLQRDVRPTAWPQERFLREEDLT
jgi:hypothetical protein